MNKTLRITIMLVLACLLIPGQMCAQKNKTVRKKKAATTALKTYPARDDAFLPDYKLQPVGPYTSGDFDLNYTLLPTPYFEGHVLKRDMSRKQIRLKQIACTPNEITDEDEWWERVGASKYPYRYENYPMNEDHPRFKYSTGGYSVFLYGPDWGHAMKMVITDPEEKNLYAAYDFTNYLLAPGAYKKNLLGATQSIDDVVIEGNVMYVVFSTNTYKDSTLGQTGYLTAIDLRNDETIWTTQPMTASWQMAIAGNSIVCGYGMTDEPDYVHVVDKYSGQRVQRIWVKKAPESFVVRDHKVYVRTYSFDYVFSY